MKDYYKILEFSPGVSLNKIKKRYRYLISIWHPDMPMVFDWFMRYFEKTRKTAASKRLYHRTPAVKLKACVNQKKNICPDQNHAYIISFHT